MPFTRTSETGDFETPSVTIGALLKRSWTKANTDGEKPEFYFDQDIANPVNPQEANEVVVLQDGGDAPVPDRTDQGHGMKGYGQQIIFTIYGASQKRRILFQEEIKRILEENRPIGSGQATPIKKSDTTSDSPIHDYDEMDLEWVAFDDDVKGQERSSKSSAILTVIMEYIFT